MDVTKDPAAFMHTPPSASASGRRDSFQWAARQDSGNNQDILPGTGVRAQSPTSLVGWPSVSPVTCRAS